MNLKGYRTFIVTAVKALLDSGLLLYLQSVDWTIFGLDQRHTAMVAFGIIALDKVLIVVMRLLSDTPAMADKPTVEQANTTIRFVALEEARKGLIMK